MPTAIEFNNISKQYRLGLVSTKTLTHDVRRWWLTNIRHQDDPYLKIGETNDRSTKGNSDYVWALRDINFKVEQGDVVGIIGKNGAGKSTLLKLLSKVTGPTTGTIRAKGRIGSLLEVGTGFHSEMTGRENIFLNGAILGMTHQEISSKLEEIVDFSGCERYIDTPVKRYSSGMMVRLGFAVAAHLDPEILVVDEVLAVGDAEFQKKAIGKMKDVSQGEGRTVLFVSHNMASVKALCNHGILLENGVITDVGDVTEVVEKYLMPPTYEYGNLILNNFQVLDNKITLKSVLVNEQTSDLIELNWPEREIRTQISGFYSGTARVSIEFSLFSENSILVATHVSAYSDINAIMKIKGDFTINDYFSLPDILTNGIYSLMIEITHPKISYFARLRKLIIVVIRGNMTSLGIDLNNKHMGFLAL